MGYRDKIVQYCKDNIGCSYNTIPSGGVEGESYNCSFLSTCAYAAAGLDIPSWQGAQNGRGSQTDWVRWAGHWTTNPDELKPGDLVFFGYYDDDDEIYVTGHVGISLGGNDMIDSVPNGGVQHRKLYGSFCGGGWPFKWLPEEKEIEELISMGMTCRINIKDKNTIVWFDGININDLHEPACIDVLNKIHRACNNNKDMPEIVLEPDEFAHLCQAIKGTFPKHLKELVDKYPTRSPEE